MAASDPLQLYIISEHPLVGCGLRHSLRQRFGNRIRICNFYNVRSCLRRLNENIRFVVLDHFLSGKSADDTFSAIKSMNPHTEVIMHTSGQDVIDSLLDREEVDLQ